MNRMDRRFAYLQVSAEAHLLNPQIIGLGVVAWWPDGLGIKINALRQFVRTRVADDDILIFCDAFDVIVFGDEAEIVDRFQELEESSNHSLFFNAEMVCYPDLQAGSKCDENGTMEEPSQAAVEQTLADIRDWMHEGHKAKRRRTAGTSESTYVSGEFGAVAMYDATNLTMEHRSWLADQLKDIGAKLIFIETICSDENRIWREISAQRPVVAEATSEEKIRILEAFGRSILKLESAYEPISEKKLSWIKVVDGSQIAMNKIRGFLPSRIAQFLMNLNLDRRPFYLSRHGQSEYNRLGKIGGDSDLTEHGEEYATALAKWVQSNIKVGPDGSPQAARLWTSSMRRTINTARHISHEQIDRPNGSEWIQMRPKRFRNLDEIYAGLCDGMTYEEIAAQFPDEAKARKTDKFEYRYPRGESYTDLISRLEPMAHEMERQREPLLIVAHQAILRVIYCYMMDRPRETCYEVTIPLNTVIKLTPTATGCLEERFDIIPKRAGVELDPASH